MTVDRALASWPRARRVVVLAAVVLLAVGCVGRRPAPVPGGGPARDLSALVDSEPAARLLADFLARRSPDARLAALAPGLLEPGLLPAPVPDRIPDQPRLRDLAREVSLDFAALAFARAIGADEYSRTVQAAFDRFLDDGPERGAAALRQPGAFPYTVLFAPAWLYQSHPWTGADFARQRRLLDRLGIPNRLIGTMEAGSVEDNAATIAAAVRETHRAGHRVILVSISKSGAEAGFALSRLLAPADAAGVAAWLNVGGALRGTPIADGALRPPASWFARFVFALSGWNWASLTSMATETARKRLEGARLPDGIAVVNLVAVPLSGTVGAMAYGGYKILRRYGPNDGVVLLADTVWPGGANLVSLGSDHFFAPLQEDSRGLALLRAVDVAIRLDEARSPPAAAAGGWISGSARPGTP